uniref:polysaccharide deacetylase family protein n=1 Tax=Streptomyces sp. GSL17-111 TaxID=3121596 RepID=UPI0030F3F67A
MPIIRQIRQDDRKGSRNWRQLRRAAGASTVVVLAVSCAAVSGTGHVPDGRAPLDEPLAAAVEGLPLGEAERVGAEYAAASLADYAHGLERAEARRVAAAKRWGLATPPLRPPAPPRQKVELASTPGLIADEGLPPVLVRVPTDDKVVFLTIDDGWHKDPRFTRMLRELDIPYSAFLSDYVAKDDYDYFRRMHRDGAAVQNHTLHHKEMPKLSYERQRREICDMQEVLKKEIGVTPRLFRPPYGAYNRDTLRAAATCGIEAVPLWAEEAWAKKFDWGRADRTFHPGDIILTHFRGPDEWGGTMNDMLRRTLKTATDQGFALARLEDYI